MATAPSRPSPASRAIMALFQRLSKLAFGERVAEVARFAEDQGVFRVLHSASGRVVDVSYGNAPSRPMLFFSSSNYLGLTTHPRVIEAAKQALDQYGASMCGAPPEGRSTFHVALEQTLAAMHGAEDAMLMASAYTANIALTQAIPQSGDVVICDQFMHKSFAVGTKGGAYRTVFFRHNDPGDLKRALDEVASGKSDSKGKDGGDIFVAVESVYSTGGPLAPLSEIADICRSRGVYLILDDAHGVGTLGERGDGANEHFGLGGRNDIITVGTLSKALGCSGGYVAGSRDVIAYLRHMAFPYRFSASSPPPVSAAAAREAIAVMHEEPERLSRLRDNVAHLSEGLAREGVRSDVSGGIVTTPLAEGCDVMTVIRAMRDRGIDVRIYAYPAVPIGTDRFRITVSAMHKPTDIDELIAAILPYTVPAA